jgi:transcriptional regulator with XRE-family HTH domain
MIGTEIKTLRDAAGITQARLAQAMGWAASKLCVVEKSEAPLPRPTALRLQAAIDEIKAERDLQYAALTGGEG